MKLKPGSLKINKIDKSNQTHHEEKERTQIYKVRSEKGKLQVTQQKCKAS